VSTLNLATHQLTVTVKGATVATYPVTSSPGSLANGTHIVLSRAIGPSNGLYWLVFLSESGNSLCAVSPLQPTAAGACATMSLADAERFYYLSHPGDPITVTGGTLPPSLTDRGTADWNIPWSALTPVPAASG
jgi:hypothetical protein